MTFGDAFSLPGAAPLLLLAPVAAVALWGLDLYRRRRLRRTVGPRPGEANVRYGRRRLRRLLFSAAVGFATLAILQPLWGETRRAGERRGVDLVIGLDVSRSMLARDLVPDRLARAKAEIRALCKRAAGDRMALVLFAGEARRFVPLTRDLASLATMLDLADSQSVSRGGTDLAAALDMAGSALVDKTDAPAVVVLLTDGEDPDGRGRTVAESLAERGVVVHCVGLGSKRGAKIPIETDTGEEFLRDHEGREVVTTLVEASLAAIAKATGGAFVTARPDRPALVPLYEEHVLPLVRAAFADEEKKERENRFQYPLLIAFLLWMIDLCICERRR